MMVRKATKLLWFLLSLRQLGGDLADRVHDELLDTSTDKKLVDRLNGMIECDPFPKSGKHFISGDAMVMRKLQKLILQQREKPVRNNVTDHDVAGKVKRKVKQLLHSPISER